MAPRKKTKPFTTPKTAEIKATIKRNAEASPLLKLPLEVQTNIFTHVLGDRDIHVKTPQRGQRTLRGTEPKGFMNALGTCRQIYTIAMPVFWSTNMFSFEDPNAFTSWMKNRTAHQKRSLRSLRLKVDLLDVPFHVAPQDIKLLMGLRDLRLTICQINDGGAEFQYYKERFGSFDMIFIDNLRGVEKFAVIPLKKVEVDVAPSTHQFAFEYVVRLNIVSWSKEQAKEFADMVKKMLLDPDAAGTKARLIAQRTAYWENGSKI